MYNTTEFLFDGLSSSEKGLQLVRHLDKSDSDVFVSNRTKRSEVIQSENKYRTFLYGIDKDPLKFKIELYHEIYDENKRREVAQWFFQDNFKPFIPTDTGKIYYIIAVGEAILTWNGISGIISIDVECDSCYSFSPNISQTFDITTNKSITLTNDGDIALYPYFKITNRTLNQTLTIKKIDQTEIGTARGADATHITLATSANANNDFYNGMLINIMSGTGESQNNVILDYVGSTRVATVSAWSVVPDITSVYMIHIVEGTEQLTLSTNNYDGLMLDETITIDNYTKELIWTGGTDVNRYRNLSPDSKFFALPLGNTSLTLNGNFLLEVSYQYKYLF